MSIDYQRKRLGDVARAVKLAKAAEERERWSPERLAQHRQERIDAIVRHAIAASPFHRERYAGLVGDGPVDLKRLPPVTKGELMERYDDVVTDRRLRRDELLAHAERARGDELHLGRYRVITTSGSSGTKGIFTWDRPAWSELLTGVLRFTSWAGSAPTLPRRKIAYLGPSGGTHMSRRMTHALNVGLHRMTEIAATTPMPEIVAQLQRLQPDTLSGFPSVVALVAHEQLAGRLAIAPSVVTTSSELCTAEMRAVIEEAFGVKPFDGYAATETGFLASECSEHRGLHVHADNVALEVVDRDGAPVPDGEAGTQVLVTSFANRVQPTIRLAISDMARVDPEPCPCGRTFPLLRAVEGRNDDVLRLPGATGADVAVHPLSFAAVAKAREVREFQVVQEGAALRIRVAVANCAAPAEVERRLGDTVGAELRRLGVHEPRLRIEFCDRIERDPAQMGKLKLIVADRA